MNRRRFVQWMFASGGTLVAVGCGGPSALPMGGQADEAAASDAQDQSAQLLAYQRQNQAQLEAALKKEAEGRRLAAAAARTKDYRMLLQVSRSAAWSAFVEPRRPLFLKLREQAAKSPTGTVPCTVCGARGEVNFCVVCNNTGKCPTCNGTGNEGPDICATCQGKAKCFLCFGTGKMPCPFCEDGSVYAKQANPPEQPPIG